MKKQQEKKIVDLDQFDSEISLYQLLPSGTGRSIKRLKVIVDSIHNSKVEQSHKPFSLLISGTQGTRTHARCFLRALGLDHPLELPAQLLQSTFAEVFHFFNPIRMCDSYIISSASLLLASILKTPYEIITTGECSRFDSINKTTEVVPVSKPIIMTTHNLDKVPTYFQEKVNNVVELEDYTKQQLELIVLQRLKYANIDYQEEKVLQQLVEYGCGRLNIIIRLLKSSITVMLADSRTTLTVDDIERVLAYS